MLKCPEITGRSWSPIFWGILVPIGLTFSQSMGLQLPPVVLAHPKRLSFSGFSSLRHQTVLKRHMLRRSETTGGSWSLVFWKISPNWVNVFPKYGPPTPSRCPEPPRKVRFFSDVKNQKLQKQ